jgi:hypothetical protein
MVRVLALAPLLALAAAVTPEELESYLYSPSGLDMSRTDAHKLAEKEAWILTQCHVTITDLKALQTVLYSPSVLDYSKAELQSKLLLLAEQHVSPDDLKSMYSLLYQSSSLDLSRPVAKESTISLVKHFAEQSQVKDLYDVMKKLVSKADAQKWTLVMGEDGCDPVALKNSYTASKDWTAAMKSCLRANLNGEAKRYAKNGEAYGAVEFEQYYGDTYLDEWRAAPIEKRVANDGKAYTASQFRTFYSSSWEQKWGAAAVATQQRIAADGKTYSIAEFLSYYKDDWQARWEEAPEVPCKECNSQQIVV